MATIKIKRKVGSALTWVSNAAFSMEFPLKQDVFEIPSNWYAYLKKDFDVITVADATKDSGKKPCWDKDKEDNARTTTVKTDKDTKDIGDGDIGNG